MNVPRGRRGLGRSGEPAEEMSNLNIHIIEDDFPAIKEVDMKLIELAKIL